MKDKKKSGAFLPKKHLVLIGAGKIGCGYLADLFESAGYSLTFLVHTPEKTQKMREQGYYTLFITKESSPKTSKRRISGYEAFCTKTEREQCIQALCQTNYASVHTYPGAFEDICDLLAAAIQRRFAQGNQQPLDVLLCVNVTDAYEQFDSGIQKRLTPEQQAYYRQHVGLVRTLTYRGGYLPRPDMLQEDELAVWASDYPDLPVDRDAFRGEIPKGVNLRLMDKMEARAVAKVWCGNVRSCILAMMSAKYGFRYTNQGAEVPYIRMCVEAGKEEATRAILLEYGMTREELEAGARERGQQDWLAGMRESGAKDAVFRVANDPIRKLARKDRLTGPALCCLKHGIVPYFLTRAVAYALCYCHPDDPASMELAAYQKEHGVREAIIRYCQIDPAQEKENFFLQMVLGHYREISGKEAENREKGL